MSKETEKEFLLRMAGLVNSENWGTPEQEADQARIKAIAERIEGADAALEYIHSSVDAEDAGDYTLGAIQLSKELK